MRVLLTGVPGVGKSSLARAVLEGGHWEYVNFGTEMLSLAEAREWVKARDELRQLPGAKLYNLRSEVAGSIAKRSRAIIDCQLTVKQQLGFTSTLEASVLRTLDVDAIILVEARPLVIETRRRNDPTRKRDDDSAEDIALHQRVNFATACAVAGVNGTPVVVLDNSDEHAQTTRTRLRQLLEQVEAARRAQQ